MKGREKLLHSTR